MCFRKPKRNDLENKLLKAKFKEALESPWTRRLQSVCDSDTDSDSSGKNFNEIAKRLQFNDSDDNCLDKRVKKTTQFKLFDSWDSDTDSENDKISTKRIIKTKNKTRSKVEDKETNEKKSTKTIPCEAEKKYSFLASLSGK